jgi:hypothetical protein
MNSGEALAIVDRQDAAQALMPVLSVEQAVARYEAVVKFVQSIMVEGVDFGKIPGTDKPSLWKAGAEKLTTFFGLSKRFILVEKIEDWSGADHGGEAFFYYSYRCALYNGDLLIAESDGSCNSFESKYRWRNAQRVCPTCGVAAIIKGKEEYGGGWICFKKKDGCGGKFPDGSQEIESQQVGRVANPDVCDLVNTIQKMAQKRAFVGATLLGVNASEFFTQDIEDIIVDAFDGEDRSPAPAQRKPANQPQRPAAQPSQSNGKSAEELSLDKALLAHCAKEKGEKNAQAFFNAMYSKKSLDEKRQAVKALGLAVTAPAAPDPQPAAPAAEDVIEGELIEDAPAEPGLSPARQEIENLLDQLRTLGCAPDEVNAKIMKIARGAYAIDEIAEEHLPRVKMMLSRYVEMGDRAAAEIAAEFKPKEKK